MNLLLLSSEEVGKGEDSSSRLQIWLPCSDQRYKDYVLHITIQEKGTFPSTELDFLCKMNQYQERAALFLNFKEID